ncbi:VWA domain-containing protein [Nocardia farcinica]|uniref:VWA domain-containing protein n=1 Tax=Nocardia farcinica TaxID=37329 RepID=UPI003417B69E
MGIFNRNRTQTATDDATPPRPITLTKGAGPAVSRRTVQAAGADLTKKFDKTGICLSKAGLDGIRAEAVMILDHSASMAADYRRGMVQTLVERALAFALQIDSDGRIPVLPFDSRLWPTVEVTLDNYRNVVNHHIYKPEQMGGTYLAPALQVVRDMARDAQSPIYLVIVTDDDPFDQVQVVQMLQELKRYAVFVKVLTLVDAPFWAAQDDLDVPGLIDNLDAKRLPDPSAMSDLAFADVMVDEWGTWIDLATRAGILR